MGQFMFKQNGTDMDILHGPKWVMLASQRTMSQDKMAETIYREPRAISVVIHDVRFLRLVVAIC